MIHVRVAVVKSIRTVTADKSFFIDIFWERGTKYSASFFVKLE
jgi:hypothetical protein